METKVDVSHELGAFLRSRRERLEPSEVGLPTGVRRRRTPGLRREEVADLAGVSIDYVVRLEQGRGLRPSPEVLEALSRALLLSADERRYLFNLAGQRPVERGLRASAPESLVQLIHDLSPLPAMLVDYRFDILAWNDEVAGVMLDFDTLPEDQHNTMWLCVAHPAFRDFYRERERVIREGIADLRAAWSAHPRDRALTELIGRLRAASAEFAEYWEQHDVRVMGRGQKVLRHPLTGDLTIDYEVLQPLQDQSQRLVIYRGADTLTKDRMETIAQHAVARRAALPV